MIPSSTPQVDVVDESSGKRFFLFSERLGTQTINIILILKIYM